MTGLRKVSVAVLSWNGRHHLEVCLDALSRQADPGLPWEILVLDNGSTDGTAPWVRRHHPGVGLVESPVNLGFCAGNNRLVRAATGDAIAFLNNDTRVDRHWLAALVNALEAAPEDVAAVSGKILDWTGERLDFGRGIMTFDGHAFQLDFRRRLEEAQVPPPGAELLFPCGGNMLIRRSSFEAAGGFDEDYFAYLEDVDLGWRLWISGERVLSAPEAVVYHRSSATSDLLGLYNRGFLFERNAFLTAFKNYEAGLWEQVMPAILLTFLSRTQALLVGNNPGGEILALDPYAGAIASTPSAPGSPPGGVPSRVVSGLPSPWELWRKFQEYGPREFARRAWGKLRRGLSGGAPRTPEAPRLTDPRTVAQIQALSYLLGHLDRAAAKREAVQRRRRRSDREIFQRFPLYLVPTYPGDEGLFESPGFAACLPPDLPLIRRRLDEVMELEGLG